MSVREHRLKDVFSSGNRLDYRLARICVLYEDAQLELAGMTELSIRPLEALNIGHRRNYFNRRLIGTMYEFAEGIRLLSGMPEFKQLKSHFGPEHAILWDQGEQYFKEHEPLLKKIRNDVGGHFGESAAETRSEQPSPRFPRRDGT